MTTLDWISVGVLGFISIVWGMLALTPTWGYLNAMARESVSLIPGAFLELPLTTLWPLVIAGGFGLYFHTWSAVLPGIAGVAIMVVLLVAGAWSRIR